MANIINGTDTGSGGLITTGDSSDELQLQTAETARVTLTNTAVVVNEGGNDVDFRVEGDTDANLLFVDAGNDRVGIGTNAPAQKLHLAATSAALNIQITNDAVTTYLGQGGTGSTTTDLQTNVALRFNTGASYTERARFTDDGYLRMASGSGGIQFGGDTAAANALDDYEEGTWTPVLTASTTNGTITGGTFSGKYTKIGNVVYASAAAENFSWTGASGVVRMSLPFAGAAFRIYTGSCRLYNVDLAASTLWYVPSIDSALSYVIFAGTKDNAAWDVLNFASMTGAYIEFSITYIV